MSNRNITVGVFVAAGVSLFTFGIFLIGNQHKVFARHFDVYTEFANLDGIAKGAKVRVAGMDAGEVVDIGVPDRPPAKFRLKLSIEQRLHALVRADSVVTIATEGVVGDKFLLVHQGGKQSSEAASLTTRTLGPIRPNGNERRHDEEHERHAQAGRRKTEWRSRRSHHHGE
jgi:phospholipid/cholesterol/gamma-HCH transport system substrate-binding protein